MNQRQQTWFAALFLALLLTAPALTFLLPTDGYSALEKRVLAGAPRFSAESGAWSEAVEGYLADRLPLREALVGVDACRRLLSGLQINHSVYWENGALNERPLARDDDRLLRNIDRLRAFGQAVGRRVTLVTPPSAGAVRAARAGRSLLPYEDAALLDLIAGRFGDGFVPLAAAFIDSPDELFYRTDPHWNARGAYLAYERLCAALGQTPLPRDAFTVTESGGFLGTCYSRAALWFFPPDAIELWDAGRALLVSLDGGEPSDSLFFPEHLSSADQYPVFLDGNHGLTVIENASQKNGKRLLVLKDSFGNSLAPLLAPHYAQIVLIDLRAYREPVSALCAEQAFDDIVAVYSLDRLTHDENFAWLR